jgi:hypothetical protein
MKYIIIMCICTDLLLTLIFIGNNILLPHIKSYVSNSEKNLILKDSKGLCGLDSKFLSSTNITIFGIMEAWARLYLSDKSSPQDKRGTIILQCVWGGGCSRKHAKITTPQQRVESNTLSSSYFYVLWLNVVCVSTSFCIQSNFSPTMLNYQV